ncbi:MAG: hypothetical protein Q4F83_02815, partial [Eubacteriales bacterium]|nr:hypothetical protein [Eubacteriales bacterium]
AKLAWDKTGERLYETGVDRGVLYPFLEGAYAAGVAWNGLTAVNESPSGAEPTALWANNNKYVTLMSAEELGLTIEAYTYPEEFEPCDGSAELSEGVTIGQQDREHFGFSYRSLIGNDESGNNHGYKIHLVYDCLASPTEKNRSSVNDSPDVSPFSWEVSTTPVPVEGHKSTAMLTIDSTKIPAAKLATIEEKLYGTAASEPTLPLPDEIIELLK